MKKILLSFALAVGLLTSASTMQAQVNMSRYITLTVTNGAAIKLNFKAASADTPVRIVSGSNTQDITVGTGWYDNHFPRTFTVTADASTMTVYGDIIAFDCYKNGVNLTAIDPSHNTQLETLWCSYNALSNLDVSHNTQLTRLSCFSNRLSNLDVSKNTQLKELSCSDNNLSTQALDDIYCALPDRTGKEKGKIQPIFNSSSPNHATVLATNKQNAIAKNWKVQYHAYGIDIPTTTGSYVCPQLNMSRYITLTVKSGEAISLDFWATANHTPIRIVSGSNTQDVTVGTDWTGFASYTAGSTTMTIYGDITRFDCRDNGANLTAIDPSHNTQLKELWCEDNNLTTLDVSKNTQLEILNCSSNQLTTLDVSKNTQLKKLYCHSNNFTTAALDDIYCALPDRTGKEYGAIQPLYNSSSSNHATVLATNAANATAKNWKVQYYDDNTDIPATTGSYTCPQPNMKSYITLTVKSGENIKLDFLADAAATLVRIVSGSNMQNITVDTNWYNGNDPSTYTVTAGASTMTIYGDIISFSCGANGANLTALDVSHNTQLESLDCYSNRLTSLDVSKNTQLMYLDCSHNNLGSLDVSKNTQLEWLYCYNNNLSSLDVSKNTQLNTLRCYSNKFTTAALDDIYCALPNRTGKEYGVIQPVYKSSSADTAIVKATNAQNAITKNWKVQYYYDGNDIPATTGKHKCSATDIADASAEPALTLYPNPVADVLYLSATARTVRIYNVYGTEVAHATDTDRVEVSHLPAGVYTVRADGTVAKMVKR